MDQPWRIEMFGWLRAVQPERVVSRFRTHKAGVLLAYLAYYPHRSHPREQLIELLWPECPPAAGQRNLRTELASLRRQLEPPGVPPGAVFLAHRATIQLNPAASITDVALFEAALNTAEKAPSPAARVEHLLAAAELYRGELLPGCFEDWILPERQRLAETFLQALHELVALLEELGDRPRALQWARRTVAADPLCEENHEALIRLLVAAGQIEAARSQFEQAQQLLEQELGAGLSPETHALIKELAPSKDRPSPAPPGKRRKPRRLGTPSHGAELPTAIPGSSPALAPGEDIAPSLPSPSAAARPSHNLPLRFTRFFGREREIAALVEVLSGIHHGGTETRRTDEAEIHRDGQDQQDREELHSEPHPVHPVHPCEFSSVSRLPAPAGDLSGDLHRPTAAAPRLVTLTGPGGTGKTRLALQVAQRLRDAFPGGVWFVSLLDLTDAALIPDQVLLSLRLPRSPHTEPLDQVIAFLSRAPALLLLDNFEHLVDGGAKIVGDLLEQVAHLTVLVTSRQCLGLEGEREFPVAPLPVPVESGKLRVESRAKADNSDPSTLNSQLSTLAGFPSVALFVDRAQAVRPDFQITKTNAEAVAKICVRLEGLPLALELAAARTGVLAPAQMLERLSQRFEFLASTQRGAVPRHRSLWAALDWSYQLLSPELQRFFAQLSVFQGGWTLEAAEAVCGGDGVGYRVLDVGGTTSARTPNTQHPTPTLDRLEQLRQCSLVQAVETEGEMRFRLLETLREFGGEQLGAEERTAVAHRHASYYLALAERAEPELQRADQVAWLDRLERDLDNLRAALAWLEGSGRIQEALRLGGALREFITPVAGDGTPGHAGDNSPATRVQLSGPTGLALDATGNLYIAEFLNDRVRKVGPDGTITTMAGTGKPGSSGDGRRATDAQLNHPFSVVVDETGNLFISEHDGHRVRKVTPDGLITTVAGSGTAGFSGDGGQATDAQLNGPYGLAVDARGNLFIADWGNKRVRKVEAGTGIITTVAGSGQREYSGDNGPATAAGMAAGAVAVDTNGNLFIADNDFETESNTYRVRRVDVVTAIVTTVAGSGKGGFSGDGGPATQATLDHPTAVAVDSAGDLFIADWYNSRVRKVQVGTGLITTVAGSGSKKYAADSGRATETGLRGVFGLAIDAVGNLLVAASGSFDDGIPDDERVLKIFGVATPGLLAGKTFPRGEPGDEGRGRALG